MKPIVIANWKMNLTLSDSLVLAGQIAKFAEKHQNILIAIAPPATYIYPIRDHLRRKPRNMHICAQNVHFENDGAFTGEISAAMVKGACSYCIIGHSERRNYFGETDEIVNKKIKSVLAQGMKAIVCVGEKERYHLEDHFDYEVKRMARGGGVLKSLEKVFDGIKQADFKDITIAYEPVWAIGTGNCASAAYASSVCYIMKSFLKDKYSMGEEIELIYGGSTDSRNTLELISQPNIGGFLVGSASLSAKEFGQIYKTVSEAYGNK